MISKAQNNLFLSYKKIDKEICILIVCLFQNLDEVPFSITFIARLFLLLLQRPCKCVTMLVLQAFHTSWKLFGQKAFFIKENSLDLF